MPNATCNINECGKRVHGHGMCTMHYQRWYFHGDPLFERTIHTKCRVDECTRKPRSQSVDLCETHYYRIRRNGHLNTLDTRLPVVTYRSAHSRLTRERGKASEQTCVDCNGRAHHWSYDHTDPNELTSPEGQPYSLKLTCYAPRCASCHAVFDGTGANQYA